MKKNTVSITLMPLQYAKVVASLIDVDKIVGWNLDPEYQDDNLPTTEDEVKLRIIQELADCGIPAYTHGIPYETFDWDEEILAKEFVKKASCGLSVSINVFQNSAVPTPSGYGVVILVTDRNKPIEREPGDLFELIGM